LPYEQAPEENLVAMTADGRIKLHKTAAEKFRQMEADAKAQGINLALISGFRSLDAQDSLFFEIKEQRVQPASQRAEVSAPPGYSEHHTGYALDLGDGNVPATHLSPKFEQTAAFQWLAQNAAKYSFELSFPRDNPQGISYEPWHWRFVGDRDSLETFYKAKNLK
jgi:D-alanyl-D-alanine carboxypeptidase